MTACIRHIHAEDGHIRFLLDYYNQKTAGIQVYFKTSLRLSKQVKYSLIMPERPWALWDVQRGLPTLHEQDFSISSAWVALQRTLSRLCCILSFWDPSLLMTSDTVNLKFKAPRVIIRCQNSLTNEDNCILVQLKQASVQILSSFMKKVFLNLRGALCWKQLHYILCKKISIATWVGKNLNIKT